MGARAMLVAVVMLVAGILSADAPGPRSAVTLRAMPSPDVGADVRVEDAISARDADAFIEAVKASATHIEALFGRRFIRRPDVVLFASARSFALGSSELFSYSEEAASLVANAYSGVFDRSTWTVALNLESLGRDRLPSAVDHELAHQMVREMTDGADLPVWLEEGIATRAERHIRDADAHWGEQDRLTGRAVAASGRTSLAEIATLTGWHATYPRIGQPLYSYAAEAVALIVARIEWEGLVGILAAVADGAPFADAYRTSAGETLTALEGRLDASSVARIIARGVPGGGVEWTLYTGIPGAPASVTIAGGSSYVVTFTVVTDELGRYRGSFGATAPPGLYVVSAAGVQAVLATTTARTD